MVVIGAVLLVLCALLTLGIVLSNTDPANAAAFGVTLSHVSLGGLFLVGVVTGALAMLGLTLLLGGSIRQRSKRVAAKREARSAHGQASSLAEENARLAAELEATRRSAGPAPVDEPRRSTFGR
jgi:uncharacterized integral membrane protein